MTNINDLIAKAATAIDSSMNNLDTLIRLDKEFASVSRMIAEKQNELTVLTDYLTQTGDALDAEKKSGLTGKGLLAVIVELRSAYKAVELELQSLGKRKSSITHEIVMFKRDGIRPVVIEVKPFNSVRVKAA
jgi:hypothetical protein